jgi:hypothetical protein
MFFARIDETSRLLYINLFHEIPTEKHGFDIHMMNTPSLMCCKCNQETD